MDIFNDSSYSLLWFPVTTPCGHVFCRECLIRSIDNTQAQCPMCKNSLEEVCFESGCFRSIRWLFISVFSNFNTIKCE